MPQMSPLMWLNLYMYFILMFIMMMSSLYFLLIFLLMFKKLNINKDKNIKNYLMLW